ncbi:MAG: phospholipase A1 [Gammaproteobacteria bacterium]
MVDFLMSNAFNRIIGLCFCLVIAQSGYATEADEQVCLRNALLSASEETTVKTLRESCANDEDELIRQRLILERSVFNNPFVLLPHRPNYLMPISYVSHQNEVYQTVFDGYELDDIEAQFQISLKYIAIENFLDPVLNLELAFTTKSWWQSYNSDISAPFRETVYEPEIMLTYNKPWEFFGMPFRHGYLSLNHQSNGKSAGLSRSWNRIIMGLSFNRKRIAWRLETWFRIPEKEKETPTSPEGDDNPDIQRFLGYGQLSGLIKLEDNQNFDVRICNNLRSPNRGSIEFGWSYPLAKRLRGYVQYFNGYGDGLINYDSHAYRIGAGFKITDWL